MRRALLISLFTLFVAGRVQGQSSGEFLFTTMDGVSFVRVLPTDWRPEFRDDLLYITPRDRMLAMDLMTVQPLQPDDMRGRKEVKLLLRMATGGRVERYFLLTPGRDHLTECPWKNDFYVLDPQTLVRRIAYITQVE